MRMKGQGDLCNDGMIMTVYDYHRVRLIHACRTAFMNDNVPLIIDSVVSFLVPGPTLMKVFLLPFPFQPAFILYLVSRYILTSFTLPFIINHQTTKVVHILQSFRHSLIYYLSLFINK